jgi:calpain-7
MLTELSNIQVQTPLPQPSSSAMSLNAISLFASYDGPSENVRFTMTAYSSHPLSWNEAVSKAMFILKATNCFLRRFVFVV